MKTSVLYYSTDNLFEIDRKSWIRLIAIVSVIVPICVGIGILFYTISYHFGLIMKNSILTQYSMTEKLFVAIGVAPFVETLLFQLLPARYLTERLKKPGVIFLSSLAFGLSHWYSWLYFCMGICGGYVLISGYYYSAKKRG